MSVPRRVRLGDPLPTRVLLAAALAIALWAAAPPALAQSTGERIVGDWAESLRGLGARVDWAGLSHADGEDRLDLRDVAIEFPDPVGGTLRLAIPSASFVGLADRAEGGFIARAIRLPRLSVKASGGNGEVEVEIAEGVKVRVVKSTISQVVSKTEPAATAN